jgi:hypothetical protein
VSSWLVLIRDLLLVVLLVVVWPRARAGRATA